MVLWAYHYLIPWIEYGAKASLEQQRISFGLSYEFFIRPWSVKLGLGMAYDKLFSFKTAPTLEFSVLRSLVNFIFVL